MSADSARVVVQTGQCSSGILERGPLLLIHGGAGPGDPQGERMLQARRDLQGILRALIQDQLEFSPPEWLQKSGRAPGTAVERAVLRAAREMELHPGFNAGIGSVLQEDGRARLSASFMENQRRRFSAVINETTSAHPSQMAYYLQSEKHSIRDGEGARDLTRQWGFTPTPLETPERCARWLQQMRESEGPLRPTGSHGTIGCVGLSKDGHLAAVTSTGGVGFEPRGRVGDTPTIAGNFVGQRTAVSCTGRGEQIIDLGLAVRLASQVDEGRPLQEALQALLQEALERQMSLAAIAAALDDEGCAHWGWGSVASHLIWGRIEAGESFTF